MGIYTAPYKLAYTVGGAKLNTLLNLAPGTYNTVVQEWDNCGGTSSTPVKITVGSGSSAAVNVIAPSGGSASSPVHYVATATTTCSKGVASMGIYTAPYQLAHVSSGASLDAYVNLAPGNYNTVVQSWDNCGGSARAPVSLSVGGTSGGGTFTNVQAGGGWAGYALLPPSYNICGSCTPSGPHATWSTQQGITSPSLSGSAMKFSIGGSTPFADILWNNKFTSRLQDPKTLVNFHHFTYDVYFYGTNLQASQALEFDINQFINGQSFIWGHECRIAGGHQWDTWDNVNMHWVPSGIPCNPIDNAWNHLIIQVSRTTTNKLLFESITLNGKTYTLNRYDNPTKTSWYGFTINYQMDLTRYMTPYSVYLDKLNFTYY
jgi:hypothetical protein